MAYSKSQTWTHNVQRGEIAESTRKRYQKYFDSNNQITYAALQESNPGVFKKLKGIPEDLNEVWLDVKRGAQLTDWWVDISPLKSGFNESIGYPTQKPVALLDRIIKTSSNEGEVVFDPFCGCATTLVAADRLQRNWRGIDFIMLLSDWYSARQEKRLQAAVAKAKAEATAKAKAEGIAEGQQQVYREIAEWNRRRREAEAQGEQFTEPPPGVPQNNSE